MHLIVTHANADFDAIASLLAAHRLYPEAIPVLPFTVNRNVRDFITLHENKLPFVRPNELGRDLITRLTLVDTQHVPSLKNLSPEVAIHIIDHHDPIQPLPAGAILSLTDTGAVITLLVEQLRDLATRLSPLEATLFLLGIYEDTGSLTYASTTARDLYAAAWLLDKGRAQLDWVREYLNYAMNPDQLALYEELVNKLETLVIHGQTIMVAVAEVDHHVAEISGIAHRLRDLYSPAALFLLVSMGDHIQLVARSTTHHVDVGKIAETLGGGGHHRAAAASVRQGNLAEARLKLLRALPLMVQPAVTVGQIMSKGAHTLAPTDTIRQAAQMMDWYGHEGFPVVATGKIVGMLSRREVDKALRHQLDGAPISQFMTKGEFFVQPHDGLEAVRTLMVEQRIGQVPVISPDTGAIIGIVTRTDLINLRQSTDMGRPKPLNLAPILAQHISPLLFDLLQDAGDLAAQSGDTLYLVGGFVRDLLLMKQATTLDASHRISPRFDLDLVVEGNAIALAEALQAKYEGRVHAHQRFGTAKWLLTKPIPFNVTGTTTLASLDFVTARTEFYRHPSALPEVERSSIRYDLHRRDFTINTLAMGLSGAKTLGDLLDFYGGQNDLGARLIRVLHSLSFVEDPTRMLRAARLMARLDFQLEARTAELLTHALDLLERVSAERIWHELELIFKEHQPEKALQQLQHLGILAMIHPDLRVDNWLRDRLPLLRQPIALNPSVTISSLHYIGLWLFRLTEAAQTAIMERLNLRTSDRKIIQQTSLIRDQADEISAATSASALYKLLEPTSAESRLIAWLGFRGHNTMQTQLQRFEMELQQVKPLFNGDMLRREFNLSPGPLYGQILAQLRAARLDGLIVTLDDERAMIERGVGSRE